MLIDVEADDLAFPRDAEKANALSAANMAMALRKVAVQMMTLPTI